MNPLRSLKVWLAFVSVVSCYWLYSMEMDERRVIIGGDDERPSEYVKPREYVRMDTTKGQDIQTPPLRIINNTTRPMKVRVKSGGRIEKIVGEDGKENFVRKLEAETLAERIIPVKGFIEIPKKKFLQGSLRLFGASNIEKFSTGIILEPHMLAGLRIIRIDQFECYEKEGERVRGGKMFFSYNFTGGEDCSMCSKPFKEEDEISVLPCSHFFHSGCIEKMIKEHNGICPECQTPFTFIFKNKGINKIDLRDIEKNKVSIIKSYVDNIYY